ncbi:hypothetical protein NGR_b08170 (plasmid) [Sinorhizobium fredii NGR234]|uniref:Tetratricopeptide repeat protein n=1 Tax=Sinorhizobium fredii (strain NBRC 101917 / NGR234) TaxID=394 RepID=C3KQB5_SINFN|nr:hypothetical protein NGR_b08170 [Sinorhizobium fredii NGR234]
MRGRALVNQSVKANIRARLLIERSIELDPGFADAHAWLAVSDLCDLAAGQRAVSLDPFLATALICEGRLEASAAELASALEINPNHADAWLLFRGE